MPTDPGDLLLVTFTWWLVSLSGVLMPGPVSALAVSEGARRGVVAGPLITAGHGAAEAAMVAALAVGLNQVLGRPAVVGTIGILGGVVLLWMGWGIVRTSGVAAARPEPGPPPATPAPADPPRAQVAAAGYAPDVGAPRSSPARPETPGPHRPPPISSVHTPGSLFRAGVLITVSNPYWLLWWATVGAAYFVAFARFGVAAVAALFLVGHVALDLGWTSFLALVVGAGRGRVPERVYRTVLAACGVFVMVMSVYFFYSGIGFVVGR